MVALITDPDLESQLIAQRQANGTDRYDEVWEGVYLMAPMVNDEHQDLVDEICAILTIVMKWTGLAKVRPGVNISDRRDDWRSNYRCPDVVVFLNGTSAENFGAYWYGGPDLAIEIVSPSDRSLEKLPFYAKVGVRELMLIDRDPWTITLYQLQDGELVEVGISTVENTDVLSSRIVPLDWRLLWQNDRPSIRITHHDGQQNWTVVPGK